MALTNHGPLEVPERAKRAAGEAEITSSNRIIASDCGRHFRDLAGLWAVSQVTAWVQKSRV